MKATQAEKIANRCAVFAESEVLSIVHRAPPLPIANIVAGIHESMVDRLFALAQRATDAPSGADSLFLTSENVHCNSNVSLIQIYDPSTAPGGRLQFKSFLALVESRLHLSPVFRQKLCSFFSTAT